MQGTNNVMRIEHLGFPKEQVRDPRKELWIGVAIGVASSSNALEKRSMTAWADFALEAYDERFGK